MIQKNIKIKKHKEYKEYKEEKEEKHTIGDYGIEQDELMIIGFSELKSKGIAHHHIDSFNEMLTTGIQQIIEEVFKIDRWIDYKPKEEKKDIRIRKVNAIVNFHDVTIGNPTYDNYDKQSTKEILYPLRALRENKIYSSDLTVRLTMIKRGFDINKKLVKEKKYEVGKVILCKIPIMVKSKLCNLVKYNNKSLEALNEDPYDVGGYFILGGVEWVIETTEQILFNQARIFNNVGYKKEVTRLEFISKPGDKSLNSNQFIIRFHQNYQLTIEIRRENLKKIEFPFYIIYRLMGWTNDKKIFDHILYEYQSNESKKLTNLLLLSFEATYKVLDGYKKMHSIIDLMPAIVKELKPLVWPNFDMENPDDLNDAIKYLDGKCFNLLFLEHIGVDYKDREEKLIFLSYLIRKMLKVNLGMLKPTHRDSYLTKRLYPAGIAFSRSFKTFFNSTIIKRISGKVIGTFKSTPFDNVNLDQVVMSSFRPQEFETVLVQAITTGKSTYISVSPKKKIPNKLVTQLLNRKNQLATWSTLRQISIDAPETSNQSKRGAEMRKIHATSMCFIDLITSPTGSKVGINKEMGIFSTILKSSSSEVLKEIIRKDKDLITFKKIREEMGIGSIISKKLSCVFINGYLMGYCENSLKFIKKYKKKRRNQELNSIYITIHWDEETDEIYFWCDSGRITRPLLIVYNNWRDPEMFYPKGEERKKKDPFFQGLMLTQKHINDLIEGKISIEYLVNKKIIEYITPAEQSNCLIAYSFEHLKRNRNNYLNEYTHCDIPQSQLGFPSLTSPFGGHNMMTKNIYQSNQSKQTCGVPTMNWPYRFDKHTFIQYVSEKPLITTCINKIISPIGLNCIVAIMCYSGYNVEDSLIVNKAAIDRGAFNGSKFMFYMTKIEQKEKFDIPHKDRSRGISGKNYSKLIDGIVPPNIVVEKGDVLIAKYLEYHKGTENSFQYEDKSIVYKDKETAVVHDIIKEGRNNDQDLIRKVVLRKLRPVIVGDKFCQRGSTLIMTERGWIRLSELNIKKDRILTLNKLGETIYQYASNYYKFHINENLYHYEDNNLKIICTMNHKLYVSEDRENEYKFISAEESIGKNYIFKKAGINHKKNYIETDYFSAEDNKNLISLLYEYLLYHNDKKINNLISSIFCRLDKESSLKLLNLLFVKDELNINKNRIYNDYERRKELFDNLSKLAIQAEINIESIDEDLYCLRLIRGEENIYPMTNKLIYEEKIIYFEGDVFCIEVPKSHLYFCREGRRYPPMFIGNSSRLAQKGICARLMNEEDMPFTEDGIRPTFIINPQSIPTRMTLGQLMESLTGIICAKKGTHIDATIFKKVDLNTIYKELEDMGFDKYGYHQMYNGINGEYIDTMIFMGPTYYQRLQKFVSDTIYSVSHGPTDPTTLQPIDGKANNGGLKIGEMEKDVLSAQGVCRFITEKFFHHSDKYDEYICRCGRSAIVNIKKNIYQCRYCGDNADIVSVPTSWCSKTFIQELESMNIGVRRNISPFIYEEYL